MIVLVVDGGGTKTRGWLADSQSHECLAEAEVGPSNLNTVGTEGLQDALRQLLRELPAEPSPERVVLGLAGVGRTRELEMATGVARRVFADHEVAVTTDVHLAYRGAFAAARHGILLVAGTGTIAIYQNPAGHEFFRAGGWGPLLGDEGSGSWIGREAIRHCLREWENDELSPFHSAVLEAVGAEESEELISRVYHGNFGSRRWASLAPLVFLFCREDPGVARILRRAAVHMVALIERLMEDLPQSSASIPVVITGGLWEQKEILEPLLTEEIEIRNLPLAVTPPDGGPLEGGLALAGSRELFE